MEKNVIELMNTVPSLVSLIVIVGTVTIIYLIIRAIMFLLDLPNYIRTLKRPSL